MDSVLFIHKGKRKKKKKKEYQITNPWSLVKF